MSADAKDAKAPPGGPGQVLAVPLVLFGLGGAAWYEYTMDMAWFSHHPASMLVAFVALGGNAALIKKKGGYANTKTHGNVMSLAMALALFGPLSFCHHLVSQPACASPACQRGACCAPTRSLTQAAPSCDWSRPRCHSGWYVIYSNKNILGKPHLTSWHSWIGFAALIGWIAFALAGALGLHPE
jgi:hypothetical protein